MKKAIEKVLAKCDFKKSPAVNSENESRSESFTDNIIGQRKNTEPEQEEPTIKPKSPTLRRDERVETSSGSKTNVFDPRSEDIGARHSSSSSTNNSRIQLRRASVDYIDSAAEMNGVAGAGSVLGSKEESALSCDISARSSSSVFQGQNVNSVSSPTASPLPESLQNFLVNDPRLGDVLCRSREAASSKGSSTTTLSPFASAVKRYFETRMTEHLSREIRLTRALTKQRKDAHDELFGLFNSEAHYLEYNSMPKEVAALKEAFAAATANYEGKPERKKAVMAQLSAITKTVASKRRIDDLQGAAIMKASEIHRLVVDAAEFQFLVEESSLALVRLLESRLLQSLERLKPETLEALERDPTFLDKRFRLRSKSSKAKAATATTTSELEALEVRRQTAMMAFLAAERAFASATNECSERIHALRCREGDVYESFLRGVSSRNYGADEKPSKVDDGEEKFVEQLRILRRRSVMMCCNEHIGEYPRTASLLSEMQTHLNQLRLCRGSQSARVASLKEELTEELEAEPEADALEDCRSLGKRLLFFYDEVANGVTWREVFVGASKAPYFCGKTDDVDVALTIIFSFPGTAEIKKDFEFRGSDWIYKIGAEF